MTYILKTEGVLTNDRAPQMEPGGCHLQDIADWTCLCAISQLSLVLHLQHLWLLIHLADVLLHLPNGYSQDLDHKKLSCVASTVGLIMIKDPCFKFFPCGCFHKHGQHEDLCHECQNCQMDHEVLSSATSFISDSLAS